MLLGTSLYKFPNLWAYISQGCTPEIIKLLSYKVCMSLDLQENAELFPKMVIPICTSSSSVRKFPMLYILIFNVCQSGGHGFKFDFLLKLSTLTNVYLSFRAHSNIWIIFPFFFTT